jgi:hypothetical protein
MLHACRRHWHNCQFPECLNQETIAAHPHEKAQGMVAESNVTQPPWKDQTTDISAKPICRTYATRSFDLFPCAAPKQILDGDRGETPRK